MLKNNNLRTYVSKSLKNFPYLDFCIATAEIKQIVDGLNRPPFMCNLSLVDFDDKSP